MSKKTLEEMMMLPYETLCDMALKGEITWSEWIETQGSDYAGYKEWLRKEGYSEASDEAALLYIKLCEEKMMEAETDAGVQAVMDNVEEILAIKDKVNFI